MLFNFPQKLFNHREDPANLSGKAIKIRRKLLSYSGRLFKCREDVISFRRELRSSWEFSFTTRWKVFSHLHRLSTGP